jgi:hypothetical protein
VRRSEVELTTGDARLVIYGRDSIAKHRNVPIMMAVRVEGQEAEFELTRGECKDLRDALIAALDATEGPANG